MLYVYAFAEPPAVIPDLRGLDGAPLDCERAADLEAIVSRHVVSSVTPSQSAILAHAAVVEALAAANRAVLPARFGGGYADSDSLRRGMEERATELAAALARVRGCVELGLRVLAPAAEAGLPPSGAEYMRARLEQRREAERVAAELHAPLASRAREATRTVAATPRLLLSGAYLVARAETAAFTEAVETLQTAHPELAIVCTGPWPPYSFATAEAASA
jgi:hypothetical protein